MTSTAHLGPSDRIFRDIDGVQVSFIGKGDHVEAHCHGVMKHFAADGGCAHMDALFACQPRSAMPIVVLPFGGREHGGPCSCAGQL